MHVRGGGVAGTDRGLQRGQQDRQGFHDSGQGALGHGQTAGGQRLDDPVHRQTQHELLVQQPGIKACGEPALDDRGRCRRRGHRPRPRPISRTRTHPPVPHPAVHDPGQAHLPVDLLTAFRAERGELPPAVRADPLIGRHVMNLLPGLQMRVVPPTVPGTARPLPTLRPLSVTVTVTATGADHTLGITLTNRSGTGARAAGRLLRRTPEQHPRQHRDLLDQLLDPRLSPLGTRLSPLGTLAPGRHLGDIADQRLGHHPKINTPRPPGQ